MLHKIGAQLENIFKNKKNLLREGGEMRNMGGKLGK